MLWDTEDGSDVAVTTRWIHAGLLVALLLLAACSSVPPSPAPVPAQDVVFRAIGLVGTPYRWGGNTPETGFDCSGLIGYVYREVAAVQLPRTTSAMAAMDATPVGQKQLQAGDLVLFSIGRASGVNHAGIYVGEGRFVHAPSRGGRVRLDSLDTRYWRRAFSGGKRVLVEPR